MSLLSVESSGEDESCGENKKLLLRDVSQSDETQVRLYYQEDTDSDVSDGIFTEQVLHCHKLSYYPVMHLLDLEICY